MSTFSLSDDGTMDTVISCDSCGAEFRFNFASSDGEDEGEDAYDAFVEQCIADCADEHYECEVKPMAEIRDDDGKLPSFAWPGGYPMYYIAGDGLVLCPDCANRDVDKSQRAEMSGINYADASLFCEDCNKRIESAYAEDEINA